MAIIFLLLVLSRCMSFLNGENLLTYISEEALRKVHTKATKLGSTKVPIPGTAGDGISLDVWANKGELPAEWCAPADIAHLTAAADTLHATESRSEQPMARADEIITELRQEIRECEAETEQLVMEHSRATDENENLRRKLERIMHETEEAQQLARKQEDRIRNLNDEIERLTAQEGVLAEEGEWLVREKMEQERLAREMDMVLERQKHELGELLAGQERISAAAEVQKLTDSELTELRRKEQAERDLEAPHAHAEYGRRDSADLG
eukprot:275829_1